MTIKTKTTLQYIFGFALLFLSLPMFTEGGKGIVGALFMIAGGLICLPKTREFIEQKYNFRFSKPLKYFAVIFSWFSIGIFSKTVNQSTSEKSTGVTLTNSQQEKSVNFLSDTSLSYKDHPLQNKENVVDPGNRHIVSSTNNIIETNKPAETTVKLYNNNIAKPSHKKAGQND